MDPVRMSKAVLDEARKDLGEYGYAGQYRQNPIPAGGGMFRTTRVGVDTPRGYQHRAEWVGLVRYWDKAGTAKGGAYTVGLLMGRHRNPAAPADGSEDTWWVLDVVRGQWEANERERTIMQTAAADGKRVVIGVEQEPGSGGKESAQATVRRLAGYNVRVDVPTGDKQSRADPWAVMVNAGAFCMVAGHWNKEFLEELKFFPLSRYKDQVDAGSGAFAMLAQPRRRVGAM